MARDLNELKAVLWDAFEEARDNHSRYSDDPGNYSSDINFRIQNRSSLAELALGIVAIEAEQRQQNEVAGRLGGLGKKPANA